MQLELLEATAATGTPTVAVVISGRVHTLAEVEAAAGATLLAWVPGIEGGTAIAEVLLGQVAPSGRLPVSLPRSVGQVPVHYNHRAGGGRASSGATTPTRPTSPLHPFGFGLSTTTFDYSELDVEGGTTTEPTVIGVTVPTPGAVSADEVVQCYIGDQMASVAQARPPARGIRPGPARRRHVEAGDLHDPPQPAGVPRRRLPFRLRTGSVPGRDRRLGRKPGPHRDPFDLEGDIADHRQSDVVATVVTVESVLSA